MFTSLLGKHWRILANTATRSANFKKATASNGEKLSTMKPERRRFFNVSQNRSNQQLMQKLQGAGNYSHVPVFIVGMPRSGTTLVEQILASHPEVHGAGELD